MLPLSILLPEGAPMATAIMTNQNERKAVRAYWYECTVASSSSVRIMPSVSWVWKKVSLIQILARIVAVCARGASVFSNHLLQTGCLVPFCKDPLSTDPYGMPSDAQQPRIHDVQLPTNHLLLTTGTY